MTFESSTVPQQDTQSVRLPAGGGEQLRVRIDQRGYGMHESATRVRLDGELDMITAPGLYQTARWYLKPDTTVLVDLGGVSFCGTSGLVTLLDLAEGAAANGGRLVLVVATRPMARALQVTRLDQRFSIFSEVDEALAACAGC
jgi:anti-anti-sigma factor